MLTETIFGLHGSTMLGSSWRFSRQLPMAIWSRKALFSLSAQRAAPSVAARNVSSLGPCSQRAAAAVTSANIESQQAAMDANGQSLGEAATARPFSDIPGKKIAHGNGNFVRGAISYLHLHNVRNCRASRRRRPTIDKVLRSYR